MNANEGGFHDGGASFRERVARMRSPFPPPAFAPKDAPLAQSSGLTPELVYSAYREGIFPWYEEGSPALWWSPDPRCVLFPEKFKVSRSFGRALADSKWSVSCNLDFNAVVRACAETPRPGQSGTWITGEIKEAYGALHRAGVAHSVEVRVGGALVGGLYGVAVGRVFSGESMFFRIPDASKVALAFLVGRLREAGFSLVDCQQVTPHLVSLGAEPIPRKEFLRVLARVRDLQPEGNPWF